MKTTYKVTLSALLLVGIVPMIASASAFPGHSADWDASNIGPTGTNTLDIRVATAVIEDIYGFRNFVLYDPNEDSAVPSGPTACLNYAASGPDRLWDLEDAQGDKVAAFWPGGTTGAILNLDFGNGDPATSDPGFMVTGSTVLYEGAAPTSAQPTGNPPDGAVVWNEKTGVVGSPDDTSGLGLYYINSCGWEDVANSKNAMYNSGTDNPGLVSESFRVAQTVGGELLSINTTALLISGITANAMWVLPVLATVAGASFGILRFQVTKKD